MNKFKKYNLILTILILVCLIIYSIYNSYTNFINIKELNNRIEKNSKNINDTNFAYGKVISFNKNNNVELTIQSLKEDSLDKKEEFTIYSTDLNLTENDIVSVEYTKISENKFVKNITKIK